MKIKNCLSSQKMKYYKSNTVRNVLENNWLKDSFEDYVTII